MPNSLANPIFCYVYVWLASFEALAAVQGAAVTVQTEPSPAAMLPLPPEAARAPQQHQHGTAASSVHLVPGSGDACAEGDMNWAWPPCTAAVVAAPATVGDRSTAATAAAGRLQARPPSAPFPGQGAATGQSTAAPVAAFSAALPSVLAAAVSERALRWRMKYGAQPTKESTATAAGEGAAKCAPKDSGSAVLVGVPVALDPVSLQTSIQAMAHCLAGTVVHSWMLELARKCEDPSFLLLGAACQAAGGPRAEPPGAQPEAAPLEAAGQKPEHPAAPPERQLPPVRRPARGFPAAPLAH